MALGRQGLEAAEREVAGGGHSSAGSAGDEELAEPMIVDPETHLIAIIGNSTP